MIRRLNGCRVCGSADLTAFLHLADMPFTDDFVPPARFGSEFRADIDVFLCRGCLTAQTQHDVDVGDYYEDYQYSVGGSGTASRFMRQLAEQSQATFYPGETGRKVLEVGSGDGEQLVAFKQTGCKVLGYEPSSTLCRAALDKGIESVQGLFTANSVRQLPPDFRQVDVLMLSYTFDHLPDPREFVATSRSILNPEQGLLIVEIHDLEKIIARQEYCLFEHEHSIYLTEATAANLCRLEDMEIVSFDLVPQSDRRANSLIFVATPKGSRFSHRPAAPRTPPSFADPEFYRQVSANIFRGVANLEAFVDNRTRRGRSLAGYGAGGRGVMTMSAMKNASRLRYLVDKKPKRPGLLAPKSGVPVVGPDGLQVDPVNDIIVFSFGYFEEIRDEVGQIGYRPEQLHSLVDILAGRF
ncbi:MAG: class I SAM-dependent methyltransferase [Pirellulales bacterium]